MMGGDPSLAKHLSSNGNPRFWVRIHASEAVIVIRAASKRELLRQFPAVEIFEPAPDWESAHQGELFREYDVDKDREGLKIALSQVT
jgi:hypothetical protein